MLINEIEVTGASLSLKCYNFELNNIEHSFNKIMNSADMFSLETELPGFHDCDFNETLIRGFYSLVVPFEIEHLVDGITTKTLFKRIESCEFIICENGLFAMGKPGPAKLLATALAAITGDHIDMIEFEFNQLNQLQERMTRIKAIVLSNPKEKEVRKARLSGHMESYTEYNIIDPRNHEIDSVAGIIDTPLGPLTVTVGKKGNIRINVKKGMIMTVECLNWILSLIRDEKAPAPATAPQSVF